MKQPFDIELFLSAVLTGAQATRRRHVRQSQAIQKAIHNRWRLDNPWTWQQKHLNWFFELKTNESTKSTSYYYLLTLNLITARLGKKWKFSVRHKSPQQK